MDYREIIIMYLNDFEDIINAFVYFSMIDEKFIKNKLLKIF